MQKLKYTLFPLMGLVMLLVMPVNVTQSKDNQIGFLWEQVYPNSIIALSWSPDSQYVAFVDLPAQENLDIFNVHTKLVERKLKLPQLTGIIVQDVVWSPNGTNVAIAMNGNVYVMDVQNGNVLLEYASVSSTSRDKDISAIRWSSDSLSIAAFSDDKRITIFDVGSGKTLKTIAFQESLAGPVFSAFDWSLDGLLFAADQNTDHIGIWDQDGKPVVGLGKEDKAKNLRQYCPGLDFYNWREITSLRWAIDSHSLAVGSEIGLWICNVRSDKMITSINIADGNHVVQSLTWSPEGHWLVSALIAPVDELSNKCELTAFDVKNNYKSQLIDEEHCGQLAWSPNGQYLASATDSLWIGTVKTD